MIPPSPAARRSSIAVRPLTPDRWNDVVSLFGERGACAGCWCMWWRMGQSEWERTKGAGTKRRFRALVAKGPPPGLLAYAAGEPVGWCALAPREAYPRLARSKVLAPVDGAPVWSVTCFFVRKDWRRRGITVELLKAAARFARRQGASLLEGYPTDTDRTEPGAFVHHGLLSAFRRAGFSEVARRSPRRPIVRKEG
jgi:GNAT superfamily N-acetyltransferase